VIELPSLKEDLALACRMLANEGLFDQSGHISARLPDPGPLLIHPHTKSRYEVEPADILTIDLDGKVVEGDARPPSELFIHTQIYRARPDVQCVCHLHSRMATVFGIAGRDVLPVTNYAAFLGPGPVPVYPDPRLVHTPEQGDALARSLGARQACVMRNHGSVVVGGRIRETFVASVYLEENAIRQHLALQIGEPSGFADEEIRDVAAANWTEGPIQKAWEYYVSRARRAGLVENPG
jgi:ribulose-5-phosphate 4-epimerase/fuculose-1-phosphate aldolase